MKRKYPARYFWLFVLTNFLFHFFYLSITGLILCIVGAWNKICLYIGVSVLLLDFVLSLIEQIRIRNAAVAESDNPEFNELMDAFCNGGLEAFTDAIETKGQKQNTAGQSRLDKDLKLGYHSISMVNGHAGTEISFDAAAREIVMISWCMTEKEDILPSEKKEYNETKNESRYPVPPEIDSEEALRDYVSSEWPMFF